MAGKKPLLPPVGPSPALMGHPILQHPGDALEAVPVAGVPTIAPGIVAIPERLVRKDRLFKFTVQNPHVGRMEGKLWSTDTASALQQLRDWLNTGITVSEVV